MKQSERVEQLLNLIQENPGLRICPMVDSEVVADDCYGWWVASWGEAKVEEIWNDDERVYIRSEDEDGLIEVLFDNDDDLTEEEAEKIVSSYEWEKVIAVRIHP
ncbi:nitrilase/cyanide hydratase and apolipoprotein N-acyltransferase [Mucor ambiguus]|uniref:Nitrilase/cyanide hydratase and apolipoprotein N-acyltransferase n=1 Tax=Mucor ambiguus TaxID=91626 RepID=A0A0C9LZ00_9FUNG|nr:nitrilase/cyanide hydratase and apolipoprotein N-acyltransferase [Mucor ambiguus]